MIARRPATLPIARPDPPAGDAEMAALRQLADLSIRRGLGFVGLGIGTIMLSFSYDPLLALYSAATLLALTCLGLAWQAWRAPYRDVRHGELWTMLPETSAAFARRLPRPDAQALLSAVVRSRMLWHADRIGLAAVMVASCGFAFVGLRRLLG